MTDPAYPYGLGAIPDPASPNDWPIDLLYASLPGDPIDASATSSYLIPGHLPPVLDQGTTPECVAYSQGWLKRYEDTKDQGDFNSDEPAFFRAIGGNAAGAVTRTGLARMQKVGYPVVGNAAAADKHRIAGYYAVPVTEAAIKSALVNFGVLTLVTPWYEEWFRPVNGVLPAPHVLAGYHELDPIGWDSRGLELQQSWGVDYAIGGRVFMPWPMVVAHGQAVWKTVDQIITPPPTAAYHLHIAARATVQIADFNGSCITGYRKRAWGSKASSAPCRPAKVEPGCSSGHAPIAYVTAGVFKGQWIRVAAGVTVTK